MEDIIIAIIDSARIDPEVVRWIDPEDVAWDFPAIAENIDARNDFAYAWTRALPLEDGARSRGLNWQSEGAM